MIDWEPKAKSLLEAYDKATAEPMVAMACYGEQALELLRAMLTPECEHDWEDGWSGTHMCPTKTCKKCGKFEYD